MFKLSEDIVLELKRKFPETPIESFIQHLFSSMLEKTLKDGSCHIREFGKFCSYQTKSSRLNSDVVRFKFKISSTLIKKINNDHYFKKVVPIKAQVPFTPEHEKACSDKREIYLNNKEAENEAFKLGREKTDKNVSRQTITELLGD